VSQVQVPYGVIFDMDGVLVDSGAAHFEAWSRLGRDLGVGYPRAVFENTFGMHNRQIIPLWLGREVAEEELERLSARKEAMYREVAAASVRPLPGVVDLIAALAADGFLLAVGSSGPRPNVEMVLGILGVEGLFRALSTGDEVRHGKPHPEVFQKAAARLGLAPARCAVIEDAPQGIAAAHAAGARAVAVTTTRPPSDLAAADLVVDSLAELDPPRLRRLIEEGQHG
jgi:beta-phosphoglucomutase family hydrolase